MRTAFHPIDEIDWLYVLRKDERKLSSIEIYVDVTNWRLEEYIKKSKEKLIETASNSNGNLRKKNETTKWRNKMGEKTTV